jgi:hypothetical protein
LKDELPPISRFYCADRYKEDLVVNPSRFGQVAAVAILGLLSMCIGAQAQVSFSTGKNVSSNADFSMTPQAAVDAAGKISVVWEDDTANNSNILFSRSTDGGATWSTPRNLSSSTGYSFSPRIAVDSAGGINVVWVDTTPGNQDVFFSRSTNGGASFSAPQNLSNDAPDSASPQVGVDTSGNISVVWENDDITYGIMYRHSTDGVTFSTVANLATNTTGSFGPQMAIGVDGSVSVVWEDDFNFQSDVSFSRSTDQGATFSTPKNLSNNSGNSFSAQVAVDLSGNIEVAWTDNTPGNNDILFTHSSDGGATFASTKSISSSRGDTGSAQVGVDTNGNIFVAWQDNVPPAFNKDVYLARSSDGGTSFSAANLSNNVGNSINPFMNVDVSGGINLVWMDRTPGNASIFFTRSTDAGVTFAAAQNLSNDVGSSSDGQVLADKNGNLDVVWSDDASGVNQILFSRFTNPQVPKNHPPVANAGADQTVACTGHGCGSVTLDGSGSSDPDAGDTLSYVWTDQANSVVGTTAVVQLTATLGVHSYSLTVTDTGGLTSTAATNVTVQDTTPPTLSVALSPNYLWPPNHKLVQITASVATSDTCDANPRVQLVSITSSESNDSNDIQAVGGGQVAFGTDVRSFLLRAERNSSSNPRVYTVTYRTTDASGNAKLASAQVVVSDPSSWGYAWKTRPVTKKRTKEHHHTRNGHDGENEE